jgi:hypothetical protein
LQCSGGAVKNFVCDRLVDGSKPSIIRTMTGPETNRTESSIGFASVQYNTIRLRRDLRGDLITPVRQFLFQPEITPFSKLDQFRYTTK